MTVRHTDFVKRQQSVIAEVGRKTEQREGIIPHLDVTDILEFAKRLEATGAPLHEKVVFIESGRDSGLLRVLRVDWKNETLDGEPAPEAAKPKEVK